MKPFHERYRRLAHDLLGFSSLWLGEDHLVYVKGSGVLMVTAEEYKRFRLTEIEAVNLAKTSRMGMGLLFLLTFLASVSIASLIFVFSKELEIASVVVISFFLIAGLGAMALLIRHLVLGPTCICDLQTRLTRERIRPLNRYHRALEVVKRIDGLVRKRQAGIVVGSSDMTNSAGTGMRGDGFFAIPKTAVVTFAIFLLFGFTALVGLHLESSLLTGGVMFLILVASLLAILALVASVRRPAPESIRRILWLLLVLHFLVIVIGSVYYLVAAMREPAYTVGVTGPLEAYTALASEGGLALYGVFFALFLGMIAAGTVGTLLSMRWAGRIRRATTLMGPQPEEAQSRTSTQP